jgi:hypothetical protein
MQNQRAFARYIFAALLGSLGLSALMVWAFALVAPAMLSYESFPMLFFASSSLGGMLGFQLAQPKVEVKKAATVRRASVHQPSPGPRYL